MREMRFKVSFSVEIGEIKAWKEERRAIRLRASSGRDFRTDKQERETQTTYASVRMRERD